MKKLILLVVMVAAAAAMFLSRAIMRDNRTMRATARAAVYYVDSERGDDAASGLSEVAAWRTVARVNQAELKAGDRVLFRRGGVYRGRLNLGEPRITNALSQLGERGETPITFGAYGEGAKPKLMNAVEGPAGTDWTPVEGEKECWTTGAKFAELFDATGKVATVVSGARLLNNSDGIEEWTRVARREDFKNWGQFFIDTANRRMMLRTWGMPNGKGPLNWKEGPKLFLPGAIVTLDGARNVAFEGIEFYCSGGAGIAADGAAGLRISDCDFYWMCGNAVELSKPTNHITINRCRFMEVAGAAVALTGGAESLKFLAEDNVVWHCERGFVWRGEKAAESVTLAHNTMKAAGSSWRSKCAGRANPDAAFIAVADAAPASGVMTVRDNVFSRTQAWCVMMDADKPETLGLKGNVFFTPEIEHIVWWRGMKNGLYTGAAGRAFAKGRAAFDAFAALLPAGHGNRWGNPRFVSASNADLRLWPEQEFDAGASDGGVVGARGMAGIGGAERGARREVSAAPCALAVRESAKVRAHPFVPEFRSDRYRVTADGIACDVAFARNENATLDDARGQQAFVSLEFKAPFRMTVESADGRDLSAARVMPAGDAVRVVSRAAGRVELEIAKPAKFVVAPAGDRVSNLAVFVSPKSDYRPDPNRTGSNRTGPHKNQVKIFGPGIHRVPGDVLRLGWGDEVYLEPGAVLQAAVEAHGSNIRIGGFGMIDGSPWMRMCGGRMPNAVMIGFHDGKNITMENCIVRASFHWTIVPFGVDGFTLRDVKLMGCNSTNDDGFDPCNTSHALMENCYFHTQDDGVAVKGMDFAKMPCRDIEVRDSVFWSDFATVLRLGNESRASDISNVRFHDNDILFYTRPILCIEPCDGMVISNVVCARVRVNTDEHVRSEDTMRIRSIVAPCAVTGKPGRARDITVRDYAFSGAEIPITAWLQSLNAENATENVTFENITLNGKPVPAGNFRKDPFCKGIAVK